MSLFDCSPSRPLTDTVNFADFCHLQDKISPPTLDRHLTWLTTGRHNYLEQLCTELFGISGYNIADRFNRPLPNYSEYLMGIHKCFTNKAKAHSVCTWKHSQFVVWVVATLLRCSCYQFRIIFPRWSVKFWSASATTAAHPMQFLGFVHYAELELGMANKEKEIN